MFGAQEFLITYGEIAEGTILEIGGVTLKDVKASIINSLKAPLLLGQSAISKFGKILVDSVT